MSYHLELVALEADRDALIRHLDALVGTGRREFLDSVSLEAHRRADSGFAILARREGEGRPMCDEAVEALAIGLSSVFDTAVAIHYDDQVGWRASMLARGGDRIRVFGEPDEVWVPYGEDGDLVLDGPRLAGDAIPEEIECDCIWNGIDEALKSAGFLGWIASRDLSDLVNREDPIWRHPGPAR